MFGAATTDFSFVTIKKWPIKSINPHDDDLESVLKRESFSSLLKIQILPFIQAEHLAKSAANYSLIMEVIQKVVGQGKRRAGIQKLTKYQETKYQIGRGKG